MSTTFDSAAPEPRRAQRIVLFAVLVTLALASADLLFACTFWFSRYHVPPLRILQNIAAGLLGRRAFLGGGGTAALGALLHYAIMGAMVSVYVLASRRSRALVARPWRYGSLYGLVLFVVMNLIVVPHSAFPLPPGPFPVSNLIKGILAHIVLVGLPISISYRALGRER